MTHIKLAGLMALAGLVFTSRTWLNFLHKLSPEFGLVLKSFVVLVVIYAMHFMDGVVATPHKQAIGLFLIYTSFMMIFNYQSDWIDDSGSSNVGDQTVDGALYHRARETLGMGPESARVLTFVVAPFFLVLGASRLLRNGQNVTLQ
jgi:hypothetical protein